jgi:hypothetical protein
MPRPRVQEAPAPESTPEPTPEPAPARAALPSLPTERTSTAGILEDKTVLLYGPAGIGKSTLASEWAGGEMFFFDTAGELSELEVFKGHVDSWLSFRAWAASYAEESRSSKPRFRGAVIDTADMLGTFCAQALRKRLGVAHESDAEWGKGWTLVAEEYASHIAKLAALPGGLVLVSHSEEREIKTRSQVFNRHGPTLPSKRVREAVINAADLVLFVDWTDDEQGDRVIYTKPSQYHEAKERAARPRLAPEIPWPFGESGWEILLRAWYGD